MALTNIRDKKINLFSIFLSNAVLLCLMLSVSLVARAGSEEEIGEPVIENYIAPHLTTMAPKDERMYVLSQGQLTHYNLNPLEVISSIKVDFNIPPEKVSANDLKHPKNMMPTGGRIFITPDEKHLIIYTYKEITLFDINKRKTVKTVSLGILDNQGMLNGDEFVVLDDEDKITVFDAHSLTQKKKFTSYHWTHEFSWKGVGDTVHNDVKIVGLGYLKGTLNKLGNYIFLYKRNMPFYSEELIVFNAKTYDVLFSFKGALLNQVAITYDLKTLYLNGVDSIVEDTKQDRLFSKAAQKSQGLGFGKKYNMDTKMIVPLTEKESKSFYKDVILLNREVEFKVVEDAAYSKWKQGFVYKGLWRPKKIYQFYDGEGILMSVKTKSFQITQGARKYLKMKNLKGEVVPINDATFKQYNKAGISPMEW